METAITNLLYIGGTTDEVLEIREYLETENWFKKCKAFDIDEFTINHIKFTTNYMTPQEVILELSKKFPKNNFNIRYADDYFSYYVGEYHILNGEIVYDYQPMEGVNSIMMSLEINGEFDYYMYEYLINDVETPLSYFDKQLCEIANNRNILLENYPKEVLNCLLELAIEDKNTQRIQDINVLLSNNEDYNSSLLYGVDNNQ